MFKVTLALELLVLIEARIFNGLGHVHSHANWWKVSTVLDNWQRKLRGLGVRLWVTKCSRHKEHVLGLDPENGAQTKPLKAA